MIDTGIVIFWIACISIITVCLILMIIFEVQFQKCMKEIKIDRLKRMYGKQYYLFVDDNGRELKYNATRIYQK